MCAKRQNKSNYQTIKSSNSKYYAFPRLCIGGDESQNSYPLFNFYDNILNFVLNLI